MANAYKLYEKLNEMDVPEDMKHMSFAIARDVHEIKRIISASSRASRKKFPKNMTKSR